jgi:hypothetical protein
MIFAKPRTLYNILLRILVFDIDMRRRQRFYDLWL